MKTIEVVAAIIHQGGKILATQRGYGEHKGMWEFPGGKMEPGETQEEAIRREIAEELNVQICVERKVCTVEYDYPQFHLTMHCFWCSMAGGELVLKEHESAQWLERTQWDAVEWLPADVEVVKALKADVGLNETSSTGGQ